MTYEKWKARVHEQVKKEPVWQFLGYRFFTVSIGSARETKGWYWRARNLLPTEALEHRLALADEVISLLVTELSRQRSR